MSGVRVLSHWGQGREGGLGQVVEGKSKVIVHFAFAGEGGGSTTYTYVELTVHVKGAPRILCVSSMPWESYLLVTGAETCLPMSKINKSHINIFGSYWVYLAALALCTWWKVEARGRRAPGEGPKPFTSSHLRMSNSFWVRLGMKRTKGVRDVSPGPQSLGFFSLLLLIRTERKERQSMGGGSLQEEEAGEGGKGEGGKGKGGGPVWLSSSCPAASVDFVWQ